MNTVRQGNLGVLAAAKYFAVEGYEVFSPMMENSSCDLIVIKDGVTQRVEVKSTRTGSSKSWQVQIRQIRPNRTGNKIKKFDGAKSDLLAVYIVPEDRVVVIPSSEIKRSSLTIKKNAPLV